MKRLLFHIGTTLACFVPTAVFAAESITLDIRAFIDGRDLLIIRGGTLQWDHRDFAAVGRIRNADGSGRNDPTIISTKLNGVQVLTDYNWYPDWPEPPPAEIRYPAFSSIFSLLSPSFPVQDYSPTLHIVSARDRLSIYAMPSAANGYALTLDFNDNPSGGAAWYQARIVIGEGAAPVPEPASWVMLVLGFGGVGATLRHTIRRSTKTALNVTIN